MREGPPTIRAVARHAGVSLATVSNVLGKRRVVAPNLVAKVEAAVAELGYVPDVAASQLRSRRKTVVGVLVPDLANPFFSAVVACIEGLARQDGFDVIVASSSEDPMREESCLRTLAAWRPAGIIAIPCDDRFAAGALASARTIPLVALDRRPRAGDIDAVDVDNRGAGFSAAKHLIDAGYHSIVTLASQLALSNIRDRIAGVAAAVASCGCDVVTDTLEVGCDVAAISAAVSAVLASSRRPQALFALTNAITLGVLGALGRCGLVLPDDIGLIGFDDYDWMRVTTPPITAVRQPVEAMSAAAWSRLTARLRDPALEPCHIELPCTLEIRSSTGLPPAAEPRHRLPRSSSAAV